ncbi:hypothetical protein FRB90_003474 [Tulasnella sp. 427]|nr:hypothetical protein FRB90_003474 [Tulasnella sp. 427]
MSNWIGANYDVLFCNGFQILLLDRRRQAAPAASAAPPPAAPFTPTHPEVLSLSQEKMVPLLEGIFQVTSMSGSPMGYLSRALDGDETFPRTQSRSMALRVRFALLPEKQAIRLLDMSGTDQFLAITWRNLAPSDWHASDK